MRAGDPGSRGQVAQHEERLSRLEAQARQDLRTSGKPPSTDPPKSRAQRRAEARAKAKELLRREGEQRQAGGQPGHRGAGRGLRPEDQIDEIVDHYPQACGGCGRQFSDQQRHPRRRFGRHQVAELPPISVVWVEHRTHRLRCPACRARTSARLPAEISGSGFGPGLQAAIVTLTARHRVSRRGIVKLARDLFGVTLSTGTADAICQRASEALAGPHLQLHDWVLDQPAVHVDETGWRTRGEGRALWTAITPDRCCCRSPSTATASSSTRSSDPRTRGLWSLIAGTATTTWTPPADRSAGRIYNATFGATPTGWASRRPSKRAACRWTRRSSPPGAYQHEHHDRARLQAEIEPIQTQLRGLLKRASPKKARNRWHRQFANNLLKIWPALWTFVTVDGVQPTNNPAERALRAPVIHRKISLGTQSPDGERFAERALSVAATCRQQHRSLFTYLSELITAHARGDPYPALA